MAFGRKTNFFLGKTKKPKKSSFEKLYSQTPKKMVFLVFPRKSWFSFPNHLFPKEKVGVSRQNHLFPRKKLVFLPKAIFFLGKTNKTIFLESGRIVDVFVGFP